MPRYARGPELPHGVAMLADSLAANEARLAIILHLHNHPDSTRADITAAMGFGQQTVYRHLQDMEDAGLVDTDVPLEGRHGRTVHYRLRVDRLRAQIAAFLRSLD